MKILFAGQLGCGQTSRMRMTTLAQLDHTIIPLNTQTGWDSTSYLSAKIQQAIEKGPAVSSINEGLLRLAIQHQPDLVWCEKQEYIYPETLKTLKKNNVTLVHYTPDPYFSLPWKRTRLSDNAFPVYDFLITSKSYELEAYRKIGPTVIYMPLGFCEETHRPLLPASRTTYLRYYSDVSFIGGWDPRREEFLASVAADGYNVKVWGYGWDHLIDGQWTLRRFMRLRRLSEKRRFSIRKNPNLTPAIQGGEIYDTTYAWALSASRISIGFLRAICPDQHTSRTFEIPACGAMMLADRTPEHLEFFKEGREADFFSSPDEFKDKVKFYLKHESTSQRIATAGYRRCVESGYSYTERLRRIFETI